MSDRHIYVLFDPITEKIRYVGITSRWYDRLYGHCDEAEWNDRTHKQRWIRTLFDQGVNPEMYWVYTVQEGEVWQEVEEFWIQVFKDCGCNLTNSHSGGNGSDIHTKETIAKISKSVSAVPRTEEWCRRISEGQRGRVFSEETIKKMSEAKLGNVPWNVGISPSADTVKLISDAVILQWESGAYDNRPPVTKEARKKISKTILLNKPSRYTEEQIRNFYIQYLEMNFPSYKRGFSAFCKKHGIHPPNGHDIINRKSWRLVTEEVDFEISQRQASA